MSIEKWRTKFSNGQVFDKGKLTRWINKDAGENVTDYLISKVSELAYETCQDLNDEERNDFSVKNVIGGIDTAKWTFEIGTGKDPYNEPFAGRGGRYMTVSVRFYNRQRDVLIHGSVFGNLAAVRLDTSNDDVVTPVNAPVIIWYQLGDPKRKVVTMQRINSGIGHERYKKMFKEKMDIFKRRMLLI